MALADRFAGSGAKKKKAPAGKPKGGPVSRFGGVEHRDARYERPTPGNYHFRFLSGGEGERVKGKAPFYKARILVVDTDSRDTPKGGEVHYDQCISDSALAVAGEELTRMAMAFLGFDFGDEEQFTAFKKWEKKTGGYDGAYVDAMCGDNRYGAVDKFGEDPLEGREALAQVSRGKDIDDAGTDYYRKYKWAPLGEEDAEDADEEEETEDEEEETPPAKKGKKRP